MAFNYEYPYTDAHRHNDDWLINKVKELALEWLKTSGEWAETREAFVELKNYIADYFKNLDVQEEVNVKLESMYNDGQLTALVRPLFNEYQQNIDVLNTRMDSFTRLSDDSTTGDAELADARVDYTGKEWTNLGAHVRALGTQLTSDIEDIKKELKNNLLENVGVAQGWARAESQGVVEASQYYITTDFMQFTRDTVYVEIPENARFNVCAYDSNKNFIACGPTQSESMEVSGNRTDRYYRYSFSVNGVTTPSDISKFKIYDNSQSLLERVEEIEKSGLGDRGYAGTTQRFTVEVNCYAPNVDANTTELQDGASVYTDNGFIMLPDSYRDNGAPTRLIISCHGAGGTVTTNDSQVEQQATTKYLVANGYAVMDVNGLPQEYATLMGIDIKNNIGSPIAIQSYIKAYHYCMENFNLYPEVFLFGASMGGISSTNLCMSGSIPVVAHGAYCPVLDTYNEIFLKPWSNGLPKTALGIFYGLDMDGSSYVYDEEKVRGYNPVNNKTVTIEGLKYTDYPVPVKFWQCVDDNTVPISVTEDFVKAVKRMGRTAYLRQFPSGGHEPQQVGIPLTNPSGNTNFRGETVIVYPAVEEVLLWFERYK